MTKPISGGVEMDGPAPTRDAEACRENCMTPRGIRQTVSRQLSDSFPTLTGRRAAPLVPFEYLVRAVLRPRSTLRTLSKERNGFRIGLASIVLLGGLYTLTVAGLAWAGAEPVRNPWIGIDSRYYYVVAQFFTIPTF